MALTVPDGTIGTTQLSPDAVSNIQTVTIGPEAGKEETTSTTFTDIPGYEITMETTGGPVLLLFQGVFLMDGNNDPVRLNFAVDGVRVAQGSNYGINQVVSSHGGRAEPGTTLWIATPPAGTHAFTVQWCSTSGY
jgi:hypothetical protein